MVSVFVGACASTPEVAVQPAAISATAPLAVAPATVTPIIPAWYSKQPESTAEFVYVAGTAISRDLSMSNHKAQLDAETHLANKIAGEINTLTKDFKRDAGDEFVQSTEIVANKIATDVKVIGGVIIERQIFPEGGGYRTYVLLKFPLGNNNQMLQSYLNKKSFKASKGAAEKELDQLKADRRVRDEAEAQTPVIVNTRKTTQSSQIQQGSPSVETEDIPVSN